MHTRKDSLSPHSRPTIPNPDTHMYPLTNEFYSLKNEHHDKQRSAYTHKFTNIPPYTHLMHVSIQLRNLCSCKKTHLSQHTKRDTGRCTAPYAYTHTNTLSKCASLPLCVGMFLCNGNHSHLVKVFFISIQLPPSLFFGKLLAAGSQLLRLCKSNNSQEGPQCKCGV